MRLRSSQGLVKLATHSSQVSKGYLSSHHYSVRNLHAIEREALISLHDIPSTSSAGADRDSLAADLLLRRILRVAPEIPVQIHAAAVAVARESARMPGSR